MDRRAVEIATFLRLFQSRTGFRKPLRFYDKTLPARLLEEIQRHFQQLASPVQHQESGYRNLETDQNANTGTIIERQSFTVFHSERGLLCAMASGGHSGFD